MNVGPEFRVIGGVSPESMERARGELRDSLFDHFESLSAEEQEQLRKLEYPKTEKEASLIDFGNEITSRLMREAGMPPYNVPEDNFHLIPPELYKKIANKTGVATAYAVKQGIIFDADPMRDNNVFFGAAALHELLHLKAHLAVEVWEEDGKPGKEIYRSGISALALRTHVRRREGHEHFGGLHEAIVSETQKRLFGDLIGCPQLAEEKEWLNSDEAKEMRKKLSDRKGIPEDDIIWVGRKGESDYEVVPYPQQRRVLEYVCAEVQRVFSDRFQSADDVYRIFLNAHFTGRLLPLGRLVEETFGEGSFRLLGNMNTSRESGVLHLESLRKARVVRAREMV